MHYPTTRSTRVAGLPLRLSLLALAMLTSPFATADDAAWYGGANIGPTRATIDDAGIASNMVGSGLTATSITNTSRDTGHKVFGGYQFNKNFALEGGYFDLGQFGFVANTAPPGTLTGEIKLRGVNLDAVGILPLTDQFSLFGRVGANYAEARDTFTGTGAVGVPKPNPSQREWNPKIGLGMQYKLTPALALRAEVERYRVNDAVGSRGDIDMVSVGLVYYFGVKNPAPAVQVAQREPEAAPTYVAPPPPEPVVVVAPPPPPPVVLAPMPVPVKLTYSTDSFFDFDKAKVKPEGQQELDKLAVELRGLDYAVVKVTGHTDRIGSHAYNLKLSTRRAQAVAAYLVTSAGVPADKIEATGVNGLNPVTQAGDCVGTKATKALIACLQPDRHVDIEVSGTRQ